MLRRRLFLVGLILAPVAAHGAPNQKPTVSVTVPSAGATFTAPATITVSASAKDPDGTVKSVKFYAGSTQIGADTTTPYSVTWKNVAAGSYALTAVATDNRGAATKSAAVSVTVVAPNAPPSVSLTAPAAGSTFTAPVTLSVNASAGDSDGSIAKVDFYVNATWLGADTLAPYGITWSNVAAGTYTLTAVATDNRGAATTSAPVGVTVNAAPGGPPSTLPLVQATSLVYQGAFRVPGGTFGGSSFSYGGTALAFNPVRGSLFVVGHDWDQEVAEISIPAIRNSAVVSDLATATVLQSFTDPTEGKMYTVDDYTIKVGGLLSYQGKLYVTAYSYYDADGNQVFSHFVSGLDMGVQGDVSGPFEVGTLGAGFVSGYFGLVPPAWQATFGAPVLNGQCCLAIVSRTSYGPALFAIDPAKLGATNPLPAQPLVYYPSSNPLAPWDATDPYFNGSTEVRGVVFPEGTRSVLFFGRHGIGPFCYGTGVECNDPADPYKGTHAYPYVYYVWAYDALDLAAVRNGQQPPWAIVPYAVWALTLPFAEDSAHLNGAAYDPGTGRIFVSQAFGDGDLPLVHVFTVQAP